MRGRIPKTLAGILAVLFVGLAFCADKPKVRLPEIPPPPPVKVVPPMAVPVDVIGPGEIYVFDSDVPLIVRSYPKGIVEIEKKANPSACNQWLWTSDKFAGGNGKTITKTFTGKEIYILTGLVSGDCTLVITPIGLVAESDLIEQALTVRGPRPPPDKPPEKPPVTQKVTFYVVRPDGPASQEYARVFALPEWNELRKVGTVKEATLTESLPIYRPADGQGVPYVVTLSVADGKSKVIAGPVAYPTDGAGILKLKDGITK